MSRVRVGNGGFRVGSPVRVRLAGAAVAVGVAACATSSPAGPTRTTATITTTNYMASSCSEIAEEVRMLEARMKNVEVVLHPYTSGCVDATGQPGFAGVSGATCAVGGPTGVRQVEYAKLQAERDAARSASMQKRCPKVEQ